jgi:hypothetical protein
MPPPGQAEDHHVRAIPVLIEKAGQHPAGIPAVTEHAVRRVRPPYAALRPYRATQPPRKKPPISSLVSDSVPLASFTRPRITWGLTSASIVTWTAHCLELDLTLP